MYIYYAVSSVTAQFNVRSTARFHVAYPFSLFLSSHFDENTVYGTASRAARISVYQHMNIH